jgi:hypothetical protein
MTKIQGLFIALLGSSVAWSEMPLAKETGKDIPATAPAAAATTPPLPGPFPEQQKLPVHEKQLPPGDLNEMRKKERDQVEKDLKSKKLSATQRESLERRLGELNAQLLAQPNAVSDKK